jgi:2-octaprenyl-6-methoxyphenol hydroxylase
MIRNDKLYQSLNKKLSKNKFFRKIKIKDNDFYQKLMKKENYNLIINCIPNNFLAKKYFSKKIKKNYFNIAYTAMLEHEKLDNKTAIQFFTKFGPIAFLPISDVATSVVLSLDVKKKVYSEKEIIDLIKKFNTKLKIKKISKLESFRLELSNLRNYHYKNILAFGDFLHRIHPLAGQGFNMNIRDINILSRIIQNRIDLGMQLDSLICEEFEKKTKYKNFLFSNGVDFIYEFFNFDKENNNKNLSQILEFIGKKNFLNNALISYADNGMLDQ